MNEQFSAFLDGEATRDEADSVVNMLLRDEALRESWTRQHWVRTTLRAHQGEVNLPLDGDFSSRVMAAIADEDSPAVAVSDRVVPMRARSRRRWRSMAGLAAVASATGIVLLVSQPMQQQGTSGSGGQLASTTTVSPAATGDQTVGDIQQVASAGGVESRMLREAGPSQAAIQRGPADHWSVSDPDLEDELNGYLVEHNGLARGYGMSGTTPGFVRVATYGQEAPR